MVGMCFGGNSGLGFGVRFEELEGCQLMRFEAKNGPFWAKKGLKRVGSVCNVVNSGCG
jgi:hypothetical protein